jgi:gluconolactonase
MRSTINRLVISVAIVAAFTGCKTADLSMLTAKNAQLTEVYNQCKFTEGPAADKDGNVYFTDQPNNRIMKWSVDGNVSVYMDNCGRSNGLYFDKESNLIACADEKNQLWKIDNEKQIEVLLKNIDGKKMNGPNDLWIDSKGRIYFTDPYYRRDYWANPNSEIKKQNLYLFNPKDNSLVVVDSNLVQPNGIIGDAQNNILYVADIGDKKTYVYTLNHDGTISNRKLFTAMGSDGMTLDSKGNLYLTGKGVTIFDNQGTLIGNIPVNQNWTSNVTFGGKRHKTLFITAMSSLYTIEMRVRGK